MTIQLILAALGSLLVAFLLAAAEASLTRMSRHRAAELVEEGGRGATALAAHRRRQRGVPVRRRLRAGGRRGRCGRADHGRRAWAWSTARGRRCWSHRRDGGAVVRRWSGCPRAPSAASTPTGRPARRPRVLVWLRRVLGPVARLLVALGNAVTPGKGYRDGPFDSEAELRDLVDLAGESALIEAGEREMIHSVFELGDTVVREVMVPRTDMVTIERDKTLKTGHVAVPAVRLLAHPGRRRRAGRRARPALPQGRRAPRQRRRGRRQGARRSTPCARCLVPESKPVDDLLREMQREPVPLRGRHRRVRRHGRPGHHRGHPRGDRRRDRRRVRPGAAGGGAAGRRHDPRARHHARRRPRRALRRDDRGRGGRHRRRPARQDPRARPDPGLKGRGRRPAAHRRADGRAPPPHRHRHRATLGRAEPPRGGGPRHRAGHRPPSPTTARRRRERRSSGQASPASSDGPTPASPR